MYRIVPARSKPFWWIQRCGNVMVCDADTVYDAIWFFDRVVRSLITSGQAVVDGRWLLVRRGRRIVIYELERVA